MYPISSKIANNNSNVATKGKNPNTAPTPATIPSTTRLVTHSLVPIASNPFVAKSANAVPITVSAHQSWNGGPPTTFTAIK